MRSSRIGCAFAAAIFSSESASVDGPVFLRPLHRRQLELLEEDPPQLRDRVDHELLARVRVDLLLERVALVLELGAQLVEELPVHPDPCQLHLHQDAHERALDLVVEVEELALGQPVRERVGEAQHRDGPAPRLVGGARPVEVERALLFVG
jgi:hypothetical protein